ncbi:hypothetical protein [Clostridium sp.]|uniref:hypothetical protein n=1 Tax=Clostridium sp. TaxID=1506 RepID=UPI0025BC7982|nr:hypothetical protein [Clostridium sp.]
MTIYTLYKNCILNNSYSEVFDTIHKDSNNKTAFDRYINTLTKFEGSIADSYGSASGSFSIELDFLTNGTKDNIYEYNYMLFNDTDNNFKRYCFIDKIEVVNGYVIVRYSEDIWHTYAKDMNIRKSLLNNSKVITYNDFDIPFYKLPMEYEGNNRLNLIGDGKEHTAYLVFELQLYQLGTGSGSVAERITKRKVFQASLSDNEATGTIVPFNNPQNLLNWLNALLLNSSNTKVIYESEDWYYEINNIKVIPSSFCTLKTKSKILNFNINYGVGAYHMIINEITNSDDNTDTYGKLHFTKDVTIYDNQLAVGERIQVDNLFKLVEIGTVSTGIKIIPNGRKIVCSLYSYVDNYEFKIYMSVQNQFVEITNDFILDIPISVNKADVTQQAKTSKMISNLNESLKLISGVGNVATGTATSVLSSNEGKTSGVIKGISETIGGTTQIASGIGGLIANNKELYTSNKSINVTSNGLLNGFYGICIKMINSDNDSEVTMAIENIGYQCNEIVNNIFGNSSNNINTYNVVKFGFVNLYGKFPQNIMNELKAILLNGFKIWYTENV